jgi:hypothetical protein
MDQEGQDASGQRVGAQQDRPARGRDARFIQVEVDPAVAGDRSM